MREAIYYRPRVWCTNCHLHKHIKVKRGTLIADTPCPFCSCKTLRPSIDFKEE